MAQLDSLRRAANAICDTQAHMWDTMGWCRICGVPKCDLPPSTHWQNDALNTTYIRDYPPKAVACNPAKGPPFVASLAKFGGPTTQKLDYGPKSAKVPRVTRKDAPPPARPFDDRTTYKQQFPPKYVPHDPKKPPPAEDYSAPFYGTTSYQAEYPKKALNNMGPPDPEAAFVGPPFDGSTTYRDDYVPKDVPAPPARQRQPLLPSRYSPNGTEYGAEYIERKVVQAVKPCCDNWTHPHGSGGAAAKDAVCVMKKPTPLKKSH